MKDAIQPLVESGIITEETRMAIEQAWSQQLTEAKQQLEEQMRVEFAERYEHDKAQLVEAIDKKVTESLAKELGEFREDKKSLIEEKVRFKKSLTESANKFGNFMQTQLAKEIKELHEDRKQQDLALKKLDAFVVECLAKELSEFQLDRKQVVETKVKLVSEARQKMKEMQKSFIQKSSQLVKETVEKGLTKELKTLKEDIEVAKKNMFGRKLFEAFASEFATTQLNENQQLKQLAKQLKAKNKLVAESLERAKKFKALAESKQTEIKRIQESANRQEKVSALLKTLNAEKAAVMRDLLESVQTDKLQAAFDKYLPAVLGESKSTKVSKETTPLMESHTVVTGDKSAKNAQVEAVDTNVVELKRLAGLK